jgi:hypothetical protein
LVELTFTYTVYHPLVNLADVVPDGYLPILEKVKGAHRYIYTPE